MLQKYIAQEMITHPYKVVFFLYFKIPIKIKQKKPLNLN